MSGKPEPDWSSGCDFQLTLFGGFGIRTATGEEVEIATRKARALLAILALAEGQAEPRSRLIALLWSDRGEAQARSSLRQALLELRKAMAPGSGAALLSEGDVVRLEPSALAVDVVAFQRLAGSEELSALEQAAALYRGELLSGLDLSERAFEDWRGVEAERLRRRAVDCLERLFALQADEAALATARRILALDPLSEPAHRRLMQLHAAQGDRSQALRQYESCCNLLKEGLGIAPDDATRALAEQIRRGAGSHAGVGPPAAESDAGGTNRPSCIVLPFANLSGDPEQDYFADGISEDIITELSRFRWISVFARSSSFTYKGSGVTTQELLRDLGVGYVVEGSVRKAGNRVRITAQLVEAASGKQLWAERYDRDLVDIFAVQDEVTRSVATTIVGRIDWATRQRSTRLSDDQLQAYDLLLKSKSLIDLWQKETNAEARRLLERALALDPANAYAHTLTCYTYSLDWASYWTESRDQAIERAIAHGRQAVAIDESDARAHGFLAEAYLFREEDDKASRHAEKAVQLSPSDVEVCGLHAFVLATIGEFEAAIAIFREAMRFDPYDLAWLPWLYGFTLYGARRYDEAVQTLLRIEEPHIEIYALLAACYQRLGRQEEARAMLGTFRSTWERQGLLVPGAEAGDAKAYFVGIKAFHREDDLEHLAEAFRQIREG